MGAADSKPEKPAEFWLDLCCLKKTMEQSDFVKRPTRYSGVLQSSRSKEMEFAPSIQNTRKGAKSSVSSAGTLKKSSSALSDSMISRPNSGSWSSKSVNGILRNSGVNREVKERHITGKWTTQDSSVETAVKMASAHLNLKAPNSVVMKVTIIFQARKHIARQNQLSLFLVSSAEHCIHIKTCKLCRRWSVLEITPNRDSCWGPTRASARTTTSSGPALPWRRPAEPRRSASTPTSRSGRARRSTSRRAAR